MQNKRRTNFVSVLLIILCLSLCVGATYAYFTDSVTSTSNKIKAGNLKIDLELLDKGTNQWNSIKTSQAPIFNYTLWEPGYTDVKLLKVENEGNLAIKWEARLVTEGTLNALADEIEVYVTTSNDEMNFPADLDAVKGWTKVGTLRTFFANTGIKGTLEATKASYFAIALHLPTTVENTNAQGVALQDLALPEFDIQIVATQYTYESDAFDDQYDAGATFPTNETTTPAPSEPNEPTDDSIFTWSLNDDQSSYTVTGLIDPDESVEDLVIPATHNGLPVTAIGDSAFENCSITSITIPDSVTTIGDFAFRDCSTTSITIPDSVTTIGELAFENCSITSITIPDSVISFGEYAFSCCFWLIEITIDCGVIGDNAFWCDSALKKVTLSDSVTTIGDYAFESCYNLTSITFDGTIEQWNDIELGDSWDDITGEYTIYCTDGEITKAGEITYYN